MIRTEKFLASSALYAVDLARLWVSDPYPRQRQDMTAGTWVADPEATPYFRVEIPAIWFRRRKGVDTANVGSLSTFTDDIPRRALSGKIPLDSARRFMGFGFTDGRHGPHSRARWDGERFWHDPAMPQAEADDELAFLREMLAGFPTIPAGFDGWWRFGAAGGRKGGPC